MRGDDGDNVGQYTVLSKIGAGGFGIIYRVRSLSKYFFKCVLTSFIIFDFYFSLVDNNIYVMKEIAFEDATSMETAL